jgi:P-type conjugative transfer protein TrbJ
MKRTVILAGLVFAGTAVPCASRAGVPTFCENCSSLVEQLWQEARQAEQLAAEVETKVTTLRSYALQIQNAAALPVHIWSQVQGDIAQVRALTNAASLLSGNAGNILARMNAADAYAGTASSLGVDLTNQFTMWQQTLGNANLTLARTLGVQGAQQQNNTALQAAIQQHSQTAAGQMQVLQASVEMGAMTNTQLQQIQATLAAAAQQQTNRDSVAAERDALADAISKKMASPAPFIIGANPRY